MSQRSGIFACVEQKSAYDKSVHKFQFELTLSDVQIRDVKPQRPGADIRIAIDRELSQSVAVLLVVSRSMFRRSEEAAWPQPEIDVITSRASRGLPVIPVLIDAASPADLPAPFRHYEPVRLAGGEWDSEFSRLLDVIKSPAGGDTEPGFPNRHFAKLELALRCFKAPQTLDLTGRWNVILGDNGTGKTTILRTLASFSPGVNVDWVGPSAVATLVGEGDPEIARGGEKAQLIYGYGAGRGATTAPIELSDPRSGTCATLLDEAAPLPDPQEWILQSFLAAKIENGSAANQSFNRIKQTLCEKVLPDVYDLIPVVSAEGVPLVHASTPDGQVPLKDLSFGYNVAMAWIVDLARRMYKRYPDSADPLAEHGIVLVDEIDLHLHPKWQREMIKALNEIFSSTQFIVTAHSPLIVQCAPNANLALLRREGDHVVIDNDVDYVRKWRVDQILASELFGEQPTHAPEVERLFEEMIELKSKPELTEEERRRLEQVDTELDELPTASNPSDIRAMEIIRKAAARLSQ